MTMTSTGLQTLRYSEIVDRVKQSLFNSLSNQIDLSEDSAIGILLSTVCREISDAYEVVSEVYDSGVITKAEGTSLDELCLLNGVYRYVAQATTGMLEVTGDIGTLLTADTRIRATSGDIYNPREDYTLTPTQCLGATMYVNSIHVGEVYTIIINNVIFSYTVKTGDTALTILTALAAAVNGGLEMDATVDNTDANRPTLTIQKDIGNINDRTQVAVVTATTYLTFTKIISLIFIDAEQTGALVAAAGVVNQMETTVAGVDSVYNRYDLTIGRDQESDTELRERYLDSLVVTGIATSDSILQAVRRVAGVSTASIAENDTEVTDADGIPAKSFKVTVVGGDVNDIAQAIWDTKPVGIRSYGSTDGHATDADGHDHVLKFFRPDPIFAWVKLDWSIDSEESMNFLPADVPDEIKRAINNYGDTLEVGNDIIPNRILRYVYEHVTGIIINSVTVATSTSQVNPPAAGDYKSVKIPISPTQYTVWETNQYTITETP